MLIHNLGLDTSGRPLRVDDRTLRKLRAAEAALGHTFTIVQGSFRAGAGADASGPTHDKAGVIDLRSWDLPTRISPQKAVLELRRAGLVAWYRTQAQGFDPHFHAVDRGNPDLDPSAARQVTAWEQGRNGLASNGADDGPRVPIPLDPPVEDDMPYTEKQIADIVRGVVREEISKAAETIRFDAPDDSGKKWSLGVYLRSTWKRSGK